MVESTSRAAQLEASEERKKRNEVGRYTTDEATELVHTHIEPQTQTILFLKKSLENLVDKELVRNFSSFREPFLLLSLPGPLKGNNEPKTIVRWDDLNEVWLPSIDVQWRFPNPFKRVDVCDKNNQSSQSLITYLTQADWILKATGIGIEIYKNCETKPTKAFVAKKIAEKFEQQGIRSGRGKILQSKTIERELDWRSIRKNHPTT